MAKTQANFPTSLDVLNTDREAGQVITSASYDVIEDAITEIEAWLGIVKTGSGAIVCTTAPTITTINLTGGQIAFPATAAPSADVNTLDDYEEGTWTPTITAGTGTITSYTSSGWYIKIGKMVYIYGIVTITNVGTGAGSCTIGGLPFALANTSSIIGYAREDSQTGKIGQFIGTYNTTTANLVDSANNNGNAVMVTNYAWIFSLTYFI